LYLSTVQRQTLHNYQLKNNKTSTATTVEHVHSDALRNQVRVTALEKAMPDPGSLWAWQNILNIFLFYVFVMLNLGVTVRLCLCTDKYIILTL